MEKYYEIGALKASITKESGNLYVTTVKEEMRGYTWTHNFRNEADALKEILSYIEISKEEFEGDE